MWRSGLAALTGAVCLLAVGLHGQSSLPPGAGADVVGARCLGCHDAALITQQRLSRDGWQRELDKMIGWGAAVDEADREPLLDYLAAHFGAPSAPASVEAAGAGAALLQARCLVCHDMRLIEQQRLTEAGWTREVDKMIGWGAVLTEPERALVAAHLAARFPVRSGAP